MVENIKTSETNRAAGTVKKAMMIIMAATLISRLLGWVKMTSLSMLFGRTLETDAFFFAFTIPDLVYLLVSGGAMTAAFIPIFTEYISSGREEEGWRFASTVWNMIAIALVVFVLLGELFAGKILVLATAFRNNPESLGYATTFARILFPMLFFTALAALCNGVLHSFNEFLAPSISWVLYNVFFIIGAYLFRNTLGLKGVCIGVLVGAFSMVLVQLPAMRKKGFRYYFSLDWRHPEVVRYWKIFLPIMLGMSLTQINIMIMPPIFGSIVGKGAITALNYANRMMFIPLGMFGSAVSMAIFPTLARQASEGDFEKMSNTLVRGIRATFFFSIPCTALMLVCGLTGIRLVLGYGKFTYFDCKDTAFALYFYAIGLMGHSANQTINRGFYARKDSITPVVAGLVGLGITIPLALILIKTPLRHGGVALAISIATLLNMVILLALAKKKYNLNIGAITPMFLKTLFASCAMVGAGLFVMNFFRIGPDRFSFHLVLAAFIATAAASCGVFALLAKILKIEEFDEMTGMVLKKFFKTKQAGKNAV